MVIHFAGVRNRPTLYFSKVFVQVLAWRCYQVAIQLEALPNYCDTIPLSETFEGALEISFPDVAEGANNVRPYLSFHVAFGAFEITT
jgi:hypothetical protein